jgi:RimJ/RimL family protein N-acetyltransferase
MKYILETDRLRLREFTATDTSFTVALLNSPGWLKYIGDRNIKTKDQAKTYLENGPIKSYSEHGYGLSLVEQKEDNVPIGMCGILNRPTLDHPDIGFAFLPDFEGKGYAFEIANAVLDHAKTHLNIPVISAITVPENAKSIRLLEKIGLRFIKTFSFPGSKEILHLYQN